MTDARTPLSATEVTELEILAAQIRKGVFRAIAGYGKGHMGGSMSITELIAVLYGKVARFDVERPDWPDRDRIVLSKGHAGPVLYSVLALNGFFPSEWLDTMNKGGSSLPSHADRKMTPGIDFSTGPLAQGFSMAVGAALGARMQGRNFTTYTIIGDGECDEGQVWEAALFAAHHRLANLIGFLDFNKQQNDGFTVDVCNKGDLAAKFREFGWFTQTVDGHDIAAIFDAIETAKAGADGPAMIVLDTLKGKGCVAAEKAVINHTLQFTAADAEVESALQDKLIAELEAQL